MPFVRPLDVTASSPATVSPRDYVDFTLSLTCKHCNNML